MHHATLPGLGQLCLVVAILALTSFTACKKAGTDTKGTDSKGEATATTSADRQKEDIRQAGYPVTLDELQAWYPAVPAEANAALAFNNAFAALVKPPTAGLSAGPRSSRLTADVKQSMTAVLAQNKTARESLHRAALLKQSRYPVDLRTGVTVTMPHLQSIKAAAQVLGMEAAVVTDNNRADVAAASIQTELALARSLEAEPVLLSHLLRVAVLISSAGHLERVMNQGKLADAPLATLQAALRAAAPVDGLTRAFAGERCMALPLFDLSPQEAMRLMAGAAGEVAPSDVEPVMSKLWAKNKERDRAFYLEATEALITGSKQPYPQALEAGRKLQERVDALAAEPAEQTMLLSRSMLGAVTSVPQKTAVCLARLRCAEAALGVERYRLAHGGELPASLAALTPALLPAVPADPFDGQPLRFKRLAKGFVVYSVGTDQQDGGGLEKPPRSSENTPHDIPFIVER